MQVVAIIPARSGSKGVIDKNIRPIAGHPLLAWSIAAAKLTQNIDRVIVSTDNAQYAEIATAYGAEVPFLRPVEYAQDLSNDLVVFQHVIHFFDKEEDVIPDYLVQLRPTCPVRNSDVINNAIQIMVESPEATSLCSAHKVEYPPCKYFKLTSTGFFVGYMGEKFVNMPRQTCPQAYQPNGHVDVLKPSVIVASKSLHGDKRMAFLAPDPGDIDTEEDFSHIHALLAKDFELVDFLNDASPNRKND